MRKTAVRRQASTQPSLDHLRWLSLEDTTPSPACDLALRPFVCRIARPVGLTGNSLVLAHLVRMRMPPSETSTTRLRRCQMPTSESYHCRSLKFPGCNGPPMSRAHASPEPVAVDPRLIDVNCATCKLVGKLLYTGTFRPFGVGLPALQVMPLMLWYTERDSPTS